MKIAVSEKVGAFAENKDTGTDIRVREILPAIARNEEVILDFVGVEDATQSFIHSMISDVIRQNGPEVLSRIKFKSCNPPVKKMITIVVDYMLDAMEEGDQPTEKDLEEEE